MKSRFTQEAIKQVIQDSRDESVAVAAHKHGVSEQTIYTWRKHHGITDVFPRTSELKRLQLENARLKRLVAERDLDIDILREMANSRETNVMERVETRPEAPWSETARGVAFTGAYGEVGVGNKS